MIDYIKVISMAHDYETRKVDHFAATDYPLEIDTAFVHDSPTNPYETAVYDPKYSEDWIIVAVADTVEQAQENHHQWVRIMVQSPPSLLLDVGESEFAAMRDGLVGKSWREFKRKER